MFPNDCFWIVVFLPVGGDEAEDVDGGCVLKNLWGDSPSLFREVHRRRMNERRREFEFFTRVCPSTRFACSGPFDAAALSVGALNEQAEGQAQGGV